MNEIYSALEMIAPQMGWTLIHSLWEGVVIAAILAAGLGCIDHSSAKLRYVLCCFALAAFVFGCAATFLSIGPPVVPPVNSQLITHPSFSVGDVEPVEVMALPQPSAQRSLRKYLMQFVVMVWVIGVVAMASWNFAGWLWMRRLTRGRRLDGGAMLSQLAGRLGIGRKIRFIESARLDVPAIIGAFRPMILIPVGMLNDLAPAQVEAILAHELAHIRRHDYLINLIQTAVESVFFYHPATWWISSQIRREREYCCDDIAASIADVKIYASALLALEERRIPAGLALAATDGTLLERVGRLLHQGRPSSGRPMRSIATGMIALICVCLPIALAGQNKPDAKQPAESNSANLDNPVSEIVDDDLKPISGDYFIESNDYVQVTISDLIEKGSDTTKQVKVSDRGGTISLPFITPDLKLAGLTESEAKSAIAKAYFDGHRIENANAGVRVVDASKRSFTIQGAGQIERPGAYQIPQDDFRLRAALATAGARPTAGGKLIVIRRTDTNKPRTLSIPVNQLLSGDAHVDLAIHPGDIIILSAPELASFKLSVTKDGLLYEDKPIDLAGLQEKLEQIPREDRINTVLEVAAASPDITVERYFGAVTELSPLVKELEFHALNQTGIHPATRPAANENPEATGDGEYYIDGDVKRSGVYSVSGRKISLNQAIIAAGGLDEPGKPGFITVIRRETTRETLIMENAQYEDLLSGKQRDIFLHPYDVIRVTKEAQPQWHGATTRESPAP